MNIALSTTLNDTDFDTAIDSTRKALSEQGFGVLTEIDMQATLKAKLDEDMERYVILGACNPGLAHRAVGVMKQIGLLLPCNVVVRENTAVAGSVVVEAMNPAIMVEVTGESGLDAVASEATTKLQAAIAALGGTGSDPA
ncbi:DUF302 domain-containing protein [Rhodococcus sp. ARC_M12]|uniref:DUF302 domain-containing protein n=1 Tax=unclassified Rhodococcus (in: high G+C Gram-positive bacteria) TaxID=192944 RepID=UPI001FB5359D|nr:MULTISPECIES: DUF302 domain-containing protein [unclassified Rhodococcus (in: high G+C Gram-positive bacteria)]MCJ0890912.1 DUF302 domain-containing protein [Rhodococcus sp. ARC_M5]MCJ0980631.1 DUF302 domain-containing protein [Rhodococcus sp. ARC_M12]